MPTVSKMFGVGGYEHKALPLLFGLECEIEAIRDCSTSWNITEDGSLRNNGREFISPPIPFSTAVQEFKNLHAHLKILPGHDAFSERTSIHAHVNCQNVEELHVRNIIFMYALYEEFFFSMVAPDRKHNIHCVPLTETHLPSIYRMGLAGLCQRWHKYTALNIKPLSKYGTLEFRHMHGHNDAELLAEWLSVLERLMALGSSDAGMITESSISFTNLELWFDQLFHGTRVAPLKPMLREMTYNQRLDIKLMLTGN